MSSFYFINTFKKNDIPESIIKENITANSIATNTVIESLNVLDFVAQVTLLSSAFVSFKYVNRPFLSFLSFLLFFYFLDFSFFSTDSLIIQPPF